MINKQKYRNLSKFLPGSDKNRIIILTGARQTGKTTLAKKHYPELKYINLDAEENKEFCRNVSSFAWGESVGNAVIDEAQKEPSVFEKVKYAFDDKKINFTMLLGSSQILLLKKIRESLAGRAAIYELWPLMFNEFLHDIQQQSSFPLVKDQFFADPWVDNIFTDADFDSLFFRIPPLLLPEIDESLKQAEKHFLQWGGMPSLLPLSDEERWKWLQDYEYTYLERDLGDLARLDDLQPFRKFQKLAALRAGNLLNYSEIARDAAVSVDTARRYLEYLKLSYQVMLLEPYFKNITRRTVKTPKIYWIDVGLLRQLSGFRGETTGGIFENLVVGELVKWIKTTQKHSEVYFYRAHSGLEVDILLETDYGLIGMEIKGRAKLTAADIRPLRELSGQLGKSWRGGMVVYRGDEIKKLGEPHIWAMPFRRLFA